MLHQEIQNSLKVLNEGGLILYPTDTVWGIGCDATNEEAVKKVFQLKQREDSKALICLVSDDRMLKKHVKNIPEAAFSILDVTETPITIIYDNPQHLASNLISSDNNIAIRIPNDDFCFSYFVVLTNQLYQHQQILVAIQHQIHLKKYLKRF